jgi:flagellar hook protein FlgE
MATIGHNLANVNTVAFKQMSMQYSDLMSQYLTASSGNMTNINQKGMGAMPGSIRTLFTQGGLEAGSAPTDLAINGMGFFGVTRNGVMHYTRAGNFRFDREGHLLDPNGWNVMGRAIVNGVTAGAATPIKLDLHATMPPQATSIISTASRLGGLDFKTLEDPASQPPDFFTMVTNWNPAQAPSHGYREAISFFDSEGRMREATIYYNAVGKTGGLTAVEYLVALTPPGQDNSGREGLLMAGTLTFSSSGELANMTAFNPPASGGNLANLAEWTPAAMQGGRPVMQIGVKGAAVDPNDPSLGFHTLSQSITLDMGLSLTSAANGGAGLASADEASANWQAIFDANVPKTLGPRASNIYGNSNASLFSNRDGYGPGQMRDMQVTTDGRVRVTYNNGQIQDVYQVSLYRFASQDGLRHEGGNHYSATPDSGPADEGIPGDQNFGTIRDYALEQSNVDYAREFTNMIITQRGFQMNSKIITTSDALLQTAIQLKR